jgi:hypothetical protein
MSDFVSGYLVNGVQIPFIGAGNTRRSIAFTNTRRQQIAGAPVMFEAYGVSGTPIGLLMSGYVELDGVRRRARDS